MWRQGLPLSALTHAFILLLVVMFGNTVARQPVKPQRPLSVVTVVRLPQTKPQETQPVIDTAPPEAQPEIKPELPPKDLPKPKPETKVVDKKPQPEVKEPEVKPAELEIEPDVAVTEQPALSVPTIKGTDEDFPFAWYISLIEGKVVSQWNPRQLGFGKRAIVSCTVHFRIARNGTVSQVTLVRNSGVGVYDRESLRAVKTTRLPPLPPQYNGNSVGITFTFNLEPSS